MFGSVLNMPLDYLSYFAVVLGGTHGKVDIRQTDYSIHSKLRIFLYSEVIHGSKTNIQANDGLTKVKVNDQLLNLMICSFFHFGRSNVPDNNVINRSGACYFLHASN